MASVETTISVMNELLSFWIINPGINNYHLILENNKSGEPAIIGYKFTSSSNPAFSFDAHIGDFTVSNICHTMIMCANGIVGSDAGTSQERIIKQMENIRAHPGYRYADQDINVDGTRRLDYALAIIATIKSFGDESQVLSTEEMKKRLEENPDLDEKSKNIFFLTSDRPAAAQSLFYDISLMSELLIPHPSFGNQPDITNKIESKFNAITNTDANVHNVNGGLLSNRKHLLSVIKTILELLEETVGEYFAAYNLLKNKTGIIDKAFAEIYLASNPGINLAAVNTALPDDDDDDLTSSSVAVAPPDNPILKDFKDLSGFVIVLKQKYPNNDDYDNTVSPEDKSTHKAKLKKYREKIGEIKQLLDSLEYFDENFDNLKPKQQTEQYIKYIDKQIKRAISVSIPKPLFIQIKAFNGTIKEGKITGGGINNVKDITKALFNMYDNYDFYSRVFDLHDIACDAFKEKLQMYIAIIDGSSLPGDIKSIIIVHYKTLQEGITAINDGFTLEAKTKLTNIMSNRENQSSRTKKAVLQVVSLSDTVKSVLTTEQSLLTKKKKECDEVTAEITKLQADLIAANDDVTRLTGELIAINLKIDKATTDRKAAKKGPAKDAAKSKEDALIQTKLEKKAALATFRARIKDIDAAEKTSDKEKDKKNTFIAGLLSKITILENKLTLAVQNELAKVHTKSTTVLDNLKNWFSNTFDAEGKRIGQRLGSKGGQKSRQNKQQHQKKYTKRYKKKIYRKRSQKHLKIKRRRHTKRRK
jgi:hypothetical protein